MRKKKVAIIGTNGLPANYGGFETLAENLVIQLGSDYDFIVYCSKKQKTKRKYFADARLIHIPLDGNGFQGVFYDLLSLFQAWFTVDTILYLGPGVGAILFLNKLFKTKLIVNHGGLNEWEREKLSWIQKKYAFINHKMAANAATMNIADNNILQSSLFKTFNKDAIVIRYGGDHAQSVKPDTPLISKYTFLTKPYFVSVSRAQLDNNLHLLLEAFSQLPGETLVLISNWHISEYGKKLYDQYKNNDNLILLNAIYDAYELNCIRSTATAYIHSHSRCGTAPSLVEAICLNLPIISYDVLTNRETTKNKALFFKTAEDLKNIIEKINDKSLILLRQETAKIKDEYLWNNIAKQYDDILK